MTSSYSFVIIGGGLSGLAAGIRAARFGHKVLILEKHNKAGGLNSYYFRQGRLFETGLHAMTNYAGRVDKKAPLNLLFRQLKLSRKEFPTHEQFTSRIIFPGNTELSFSNDIELLESEIATRFPASIDSFRTLSRIVVDYDPFTPAPFLSTRARLMEILGNETLINMLLWPLMMYGSSVEHDMDFSQFVIMFRAIYLEGFFRPQGTIKDFLDRLLKHYKTLGGEILFNAAVDCFDLRENKVNAIRLKNGERINCDYVMSTAGYPATLDFIGEEKNNQTAATYEGRMSFMEFIYLLNSNFNREAFSGETILFYNLAEPFDYCRPQQAVNVDCGVICFPENFQGLSANDEFQLRITHPANYSIWKNSSADDYQRIKEDWGKRSQSRLAEIIGNWRENIVYEDSFTPLTIERYTDKRQGAVYGSPVKIKDGRTAFDNLFIAGTDQGYLGIVGAMLSGVTMVNNHILDKI